MTEEGVITIEPQNGTEAFALAEWEKKNKVPEGNDSAGYDWRGQALEIVKKN